MLQSWGRKTSFPNGDNATLAAAEVRFAASLLAHNPAAEWSAKVLLKSHKALCYQLSQYFSTCQNLITSSTHILAPNDSLWSETDKGLELPTHSVCSNTIWNKCLHLKVLAQTHWDTYCTSVSLDKWEACVGYQQPPLSVCSESTAKRNREGVTKSEVEVPDYYNLPIWPQRGLWNGLKWAVWGHRHAWAMDPM